MLALPLLMPWILYADLGSLYTGGAAAFWEPTWLLAVALGALVLTVAAGDPAVSAVAGWGGLLAAGGAVLARAGGLGADLGREAEQAGLIAAALGVAAVAGAALEAGARRRRARGTARGGGGGGRRWRRWCWWAARWRWRRRAAPGFPEDRYSDLLAFATAGGDTGSRVLLFGPAADLPGTSRDFEGLGYRVLAPPYPESWDAYLPAPRLGDEALRRLLDDLLDGEVRRAGERLAVFGIGWVAFTEESPLEAVFEAQLDMVPLRGLALPVFRNEVPATEAYGPGGTPWTRDGTGYLRPDGAPVRPGVRGLQRRLPVGPRELEPGRLGQPGRHRRHRGALRRARRAAQPGPGLGRLAGGTGGPAGRRAGGGGGGSDEAPARPAWRWGRRWPGPCCCPPRSRRRSP